MLCGLLSWGLISNRSTCYTWLVKGKARMINKYRYSVTSVNYRCVCVCVCVRAHIYIYTHTHTHTHERANVELYVCLCVYTQTHTYHSTSAISRTRLCRQQINNVFFCIMSNFLVLYSSISIVIIDTIILPLRAGGKFFSFHQKLFLCDYKS